MTILTAPTRLSTRSLPLIALLLAVMLLIASCANSADRIKRDCSTAPLDTSVKIDESGSSSSEALRAERLTIVRALVEKTVVCGGHFTADLFSSSSGATVNLYSGELTIDAPTEKAALRKAPEKVDAVMAAIDAAYGPALALLPQGGSDISSILRLFGEQATQFPDAYHDYTIVTDGVQNIGAVQITGPLTPEQAQTLADQVVVPTLPPESSLTIAGIGRVSGDPLPSTVVEGMVSFYTAIAKRTGAQQVMVVTELVR